MHARELCVQQRRQDPRPSGFGPTEGRRRFVHAMKIEQERAPARRLLKAEPQVVIKPVRQQEISPIAEEVLPVTLNESGGKDGRGGR